MSSATFMIGSDGLTTMSNGKSAISATGAKSLWM